MQTRVIAAAALLAIAHFRSPATAQQMQMHGMIMPTKSTQKKTATKKRVSKKRAAAKRATGTRKSAAVRTEVKPEASPKADHPDSQGMTMPMGDRTMSMPDEPAPGPQTAMPMDHGPMGQMPTQPMPHDGNAMHATAMSGALGPYSMARESSGTAWQPDTSEHMGLQVMSGGWALMADGVLNLVYDHQSGLRGDDKAFASGMLMGMASRPLADGRLQLKAMLSPDPLMGPSGYPLLLASGETANGRDRLIDRQHPHDLFMELSGSVSQNIGSKSSLFVYAALPGEPAFGPPSFMDRESIMDSPEAPITHHWLDSTHISFGVLTGGLVLDRVKLEVSRFNGREPDQHRWDIETGSLDSTAIRVSWNPTRTLALQGSWGHFVDPEQLEPGVDQKRLSASAMWANEIAPGWKLATTLAWGRKTVLGHKDDGFAAEASLKHGPWTVFGRGEMTQNRELIHVEDGPAYRVGKVSVGAVRDFRVAGHLSLGAGGLFSINFVPDTIAPLYGGSNPTGAMLFLRLKLQ